MRLRCGGLSCPLPDIRRYATARCEKPWNSLHSCFSAGWVKRHVKRAWTNILSSFQNASSSQPRWEEQNMHSGSDTNRSHTGSPEKGMGKASFGYQSISDPMAMLHSERQTPFCEFYHLTFGYTSKRTIHAAQICLLSSSLPKYGEHSLAVK